MYAAREKGRTEGLQEGLAEGQQKGRLEGSMASREEIARNMKARGYKPEEIQALTGLSGEEIDNGSPV